MTITSGNNPVGIAMFGVDKEDSDLIRAIKKRTNIHEYTHGVQYSPWGHLYNPARAERSTSPCWLGEGNATFTGYAAGTTNYEDYLDVRSKIVENRHSSLPFTDYSTSRILEYYNNNTIVTSYEEGMACRENSDFKLAYTVGMLTVEALSAISGSTSSMYLYKYMALGMTYEEAFEMIYGSSWEEAKPTLASFVSSTINLVFLSIDSIDRANSYFEEGVSSFNLGLYEDAIENFNEAIESGPKKNFYGWRGSSYFQLGQYENAIQDYTSEITLFDGSAVIYANRATSYRQLGDYANADSDDAKACSLDSQYC